MLSSRMRELRERHELTAQCECSWDLDAGEILIGGVTFPLVAVGTVSGD